MAKPKEKQKLTCRLGPEIVQLFTRKAGAMAHKLDRRRKTRDKRKRVQEALKEY